MAKAKEGADLPQSVYTKELTGDNAEGGKEEYPDEYVENGMEEDVKENVKEGPENGGRFRR